MFLGILSSIHCTQARIRDSLCRIPFEAIFMYLYMHILCKIYACSIYIAYYIHHHCHHYYVPSVVNRSAVMDLHRSRSCATLMESLYDIFVHSLMLAVHIVLGLRRPLLPFIFPSISNRCTPFPLIICPKY